ncbi:Polyprenyl synthetase family protein [Tritrichomonas foetus]|uniref:Polyprenyl synthetase family protein n=1 Tax=Tritrichomonas foetus TaxID=1144522 RepID=A0A1J4KB41_9EUKA|nr:Polyprenyl synthetase family protein [Tritrichomonas foetus]|eukprot:OHT08120.1 Polyprenyl synthetase family protein [Tritrichomonas foetus]
MTKIKGQDQFFAFRSELFRYVHDEILLKWPENDLSNHFDELLDYTTDGGKCLRGLLSVCGYLELTGVDPDSDEAKPAYALGWIQEILQASFLVADDLMDNSLLRRGKPCWYVKDNNSYSAVSDSYFLENVIYLIVDHYFEGFPADTVRDIKQLLHYTTIKTAFGQFIDMYPKEPSLENWNLTVLNKTSYYSIWQPFVSGICASQKVPKEVWNSDQLRESLLIAGKLFQCQDDWIDLYGSSAKTGKVGTDIQDGKCTWLLGKAMEVANDEQKRLLKENIGHQDKEKIALVQKIYSDLNIEKYCIDHQDSEYERLKEMFQKIDPRIPSALKDWLLSFLDHRKY